MNGLFIQNSSGQNELREVISVTSNTVLTIDRPTSFTNTACNFYKAPVAWVEAVKSSHLDGGKSNNARISIFTSKQFSQIF